MVIRNYILGVRNIFSISEKKKFIELREMPYFRFYRIIKT